jgi:hypothetical protein
VKSVRRRVRRSLMSSRLEPRIPSASRSKACASAPGHRPATCGEEVGRDLGDMQATLGIG